MLNKTGRQQVGRGQLLLKMITVQELNVQEKCSWFCLSAELNIELKYPLSQITFS